MQPQDGSATVGQDTMAYCVREIGMLRKQFELHGGELDARCLPVPTPLRSRR